MKDLVPEDNKILLSIAEEVQLPLSEEDLEILKGMSAFVLESQIKELDDNGEPYRQAVAIAAPQLGISKRMFVISTVDDAGTLFTMTVVNPKIQNHSKSLIVLPDGEGCMSVIGRRGLVPRYQNIRWSGTLVDLETGETEYKYMSKVDGYLGIIFQHEYDHLDGILFTSKMTEEFPDVPVVEESALPEKEIIKEDE